MNIGLKDAVRTSYDGKAFWQIPETYIRGNTIKYIRVPDAVLDVAAEDRVARDAAVSENYLINLQHSKEMEKENESDQLTNKSFLKCFNLVEKPRERWPFTKWWWKGRRKGPR